MYARPLYTTSFERWKKLNIETCVALFFFEFHNCFPFCISSFSYHTFSPLPSRLSARTIAGLKVWFIEVMTVSVLYCTAVRFLVPLDSFRFVSRFTHTHQDIYDYAKSRFICFFINSELLQNIREVYKCIALMKFLSREFMIFLFNIVMCISFLHYNSEIEKLLKYLINRIIVI